MLDLKTGFDEVQMGINNGCAEKDLVEKRPGHFLKIGKRPCENFFDIKDDMYFISVIS